MMSEIQGRKYSVHGVEIAKPWPRINLPPGEYWLVKDSDGDWYVEGDLSEGDHFAGCVIGGVKPPVGSKAARDGRLHLTVEGPVMVEMD